MQRRGRLEDQDLGAVLRAAAEGAITGGVEVEADVGGTVYLDGGAVTFATVGGAALPEPAGGAALREHVVTAVAVLLAQRVGWYHHHQFHQEGGRPPVVPTVRLPVAGLLEAAEERADRAADLGRWQAAVVRPLDRALPASVALEPDQWAVVAALLRPSPAVAVADRLGWDHHRVATALDRLADHGLLGDRVAPARAGADRPSPPTPTTPPPSPGPGPALAAALATRLDPDDLVAAVGPAPGGLEPVDRRRSALGRLIQSLRS